MLTTALDETRLEAFLEDHWAPACRVATAVIGDPVGAEDVVQDSLVRLIRDARRRGPPRDVRTWFYRILVNAARNHVRGRERRTVHEAASPLPVAEELCVDRVEWVRTNLERLEPDTRAALTLKYLEDLSFKDVAEVLGCPEGTAASRVRRGLAALRARLEPEHVLLSPALLLCGLVPNPGVPPKAAALFARADPSGAGSPETPDAASGVHSTSALPPRALPSAPRLTLAVGAALALVVAASLTIGLSPSASRHVEERRLATPRVRTSPMASPVVHDPTATPLVQVERQALPLGEAPMAPSQKLKKATTGEYSYQNLAKGPRALRRRLSTRVDRLLQPSEAHFARRRQHST